MIVEKHEVKLGNHGLHRLVLKPEIPVRGGLVFFHGQGDFIDRYPPLLEGFVEAGYQCLLTDLPGHGLSPGRRGHVPGLDFVEALLEESLTHLEGPLVIAGHSMGGLMALRFLLRQPARFHAAWLSSPLLRVLARAGPGLRFLLPVLSRIAPRLTVDTGVTREQCDDHPEGSDPGDSGEDILYHSRISLSWGVDLVKASDYVWDKISGLPSDKPVLFTQGGDDPVCPPNALTELLAKTHSPRASLKLLAGARHEPFSGSTREILLERLRLWINEELTPLKILPP